MVSKTMIRSIILMASLKRELCQTVKIGFQDIQNLKFHPKISHMCYLNFFAGNIILIKQAPCVWYMYMTWTLHRSWNTACLSCFCNFSVDKFAICLPVNWHSSHGALRNLYFHWSWKTHLLLGVDCDISTAYCWSVDWLCLIINSTMAVGDWCISIIAVVVNDWRILILIVLIRSCSLHLFKPWWITYSITPATAFRDTFCRAIVWVIQLLFH